ncbi:MAG: 8-oxoguanine DNA glycosylase [Lachnospiraceae bacterium]|nr:8-oxoguanine DNA glycosylase [Lachnospiraceae bacterium]
MIQMHIPNLNLRQIAESGQAFRWVKADENTYSVISAGKFLTIKEDGEDFTFSCSQKEWDEYWSTYFDMETDYVAIGSLIEKSGDEHLLKAYKEGKGVRILKQDLWEIIVTFMISQNNNIARITKSVAALCEAAGKKTCGGYAFPKPGEVDPEVFEKKELGFGYRAEYLREIYDFAAGNPQWMEKLKGLSYEEAMEELLLRKGIGKKVANCICLFGLHHVDAFPIDTHVKQLLEKYYPNGFDFEYFKGVAGIIQQYLFYYELRHPE